MSSAKFITTLLVFLVVAVTSNTAQEDVCFADSSVGGSICECTAPPPALPPRPLFCCFDSEPPVLVCQNITREADVNSCSTNIETYNINATDNCDHTYNLTIDCSQPTGSSFEVGTTIVNCSATDSLSNVGHCSFEVTIIDSEHPILGCSSVTHEADVSSCTANVETYNINATDNCDPFHNLIINCSQPTGYSFEVGTTIVNCSATDSLLNVGHCSFDVTVIDAELPDITCPGDITEEAAPGESVTVSYNTSATDNCDGSLSPTCTPSSGSSFSGPITNVTCNASDSSGNTDTCMFYVLIYEITTTPEPTTTGEITTLTTQTVTVPLVTSGGGTTSAGTQAPPTATDSTSPHSASQTSVTQMTEEIRSTTSSSVGSTTTQCVPCDIERDPKRKSSSNCENKDEVCVGTSCEFLCSSFERNSTNWEGRQCEEDGEWNEPIPFCADLYATMHSKHTEDSSPVSKRDVLTSDNQLVQTIEETLQSTVANMEETYLVRVNVTAAQNDSDGIIQSNLFIETMYSSGITLDLYIESVEQSIESVTEFQVLSVNVEDKDSVDNYCSSNPCNNGGDCSVDYTNLAVTCDCYSDYSGTFCETNKTLLVAILVPSSLVFLALCVVLGFTWFHLRRSDKKGSSTGSGTRSNRDHDMNEATVSEGDVIVDADSPRETEHPMYFDNKAFDKEASVKESEQGQGLVGDRSYPDDAGSPVYYDTSMTSRTPVPYSHTRSGYNGQQYAGSGQSQNVYHVYDKPLSEISSYREKQLEDTYF